VSPPLIIMWITGLMVFTGIYIGCLVLILIGLIASFALCLSGCLIGLSA